MDSNSIDNGSGKEGLAEFTILRVSLMREVNLLLVLACGGISVDKTYREVIWNLTCTVTIWMCVYTHE